jgi:transposase
MFLLTIIILDICNTYFNMGRRNDLTIEEKTKIDVLSQTGLTNNQIANEIHRHKSCISRHINKKRSIKGKKVSGRKQKLSSRTKRQIFKCAIKENKTCGIIKRDLKLDVSRWTIARSLKENPNVRYMKMKKCPLLKKIHIEKRLQFAKETMAFGEKWKDVLFSDEKKFNLDGPDGFKYYWADLTTEKKVFSKRVGGGGSVMIWGAFSSKGKSELLFINTRLNADGYQQLIEDELIECQNRNNNMIFQQDNAPIHVARSTMKWFETHNIKVLNWPPLSPDLNPIENIWGIMAREIYDGGKQFSNVNELKTAIQNSWNNVDEEIIKKLINSMNNRIFELISVKGKKINY